MTLRKYSASKLSTSTKFSASANNFRTIVRKKVSVNIIQAGDPPPPPPPSYYLWSWGRNGYGNLGLGDTTNRSSPIQVGASTDWLRIAAGHYYAISIKNDGTLWSWGHNNNAQLGLNNTTNYSSPKQVGALTNWSKISSGHLHTSAIKTDGSLWSWGNNGFGRLGLGNTTNYSSPKQVGALTTWSNIEAGFFGQLAVKTDGTLWSWGYNEFNGALGLGDTFNRSSPTQVGALTTWSNTSITAGTYNTLAIQTNGTLWAWGYNYYGQLGLGNTTNRSSPTQVGSLTTWSKASAGAYHTVAIKTDGTLWAWGYNAYGQLGLGNTTNYSSPKQVGALTTWSFVTCGGTGYHNLAVKTDGTLWVWGWNSHGQLGLGNTTSYSSPKQVGVLTNWSSDISAGALSSFAILT